MKKYTFIVFFIIFFSLAFSIPENYHDPAGYPASWPDEIQWIPYTYLGESIHDLEGGNDGSNGGATPQRAADIVFSSEPSVSFFADGTVFFVRFVLSSSPLALTGNGKPFISATWNILIDVDGDGFKEFVVQLDGTDQSTNPDDIKVYYANNPAQNYTDLDLIWRQDSARHPTDSTQYLVDGEPGKKATEWDADPLATVTDFGRTRVIEENGVYFLDIQIPIAALDASHIDGYKIDQNSRFSLALTTSNSNTDPAQKDFVYPGDFVMDPSFELPFGDSIDIFGNTYQNPWFPDNGVSYSGSCPSITLYATAVDTFIANQSGALETSIQSVGFYVYYDRNGNELDDDGFSWKFIGNGFLSPGELNPWSIIWDASAEINGQYLIKAIARDTDGNTMDSFMQYVDREAPVYATATIVCGTAPLTLSGIIFEDIDADGLPRETGEPGKSNVRIRLYFENDGSNGLTADDTFISESITDSSGNFSFSYLPKGIFYVVADSKGVMPENLNAGYSQEDVWAEQTYGGGTYSPGPKFGGVSPEISDVFTNDTPVASNTYEHVVRVDLVSNYTSADMGFSFEVIVNHLDSGNNGRSFPNQGSLRQFILNANAIEGRNLSKFVLRTPPNSSSGSNSWWTVNLKGVLPEIVDDETVIDGCVYDEDGNILDTNQSHYGSTTVGIKGFQISDFEGAELEINVKGFDYGILGTASGIELRNFSVFNAGGALGELKAAVKINGSFSLYNLTLGARADGSNPLTEKNKRYGILALGSGTIERVYAAYNGSGAFYLQTSNATLTEIVATQNAAELTGIDGNGLVIKGKAAISNSLIEETGDSNYGFDRGNGIFLDNAGNAIIDNVSLLSNAGAGISLYKSNEILVQNTVIANNSGPGIRAGNDSKSNEFTRNSFSGNGGISIDLVDGSTVFQDGVTANDGVWNISSANNGIDSPVITDTSLENGILTVDGYVGLDDGSTAFSGARIEIYEAIQGAGDSYGGSYYGEGFRYLGYTTCDSNDNFSVEIPVGSSSIEFITALAILDKHTSEFGKNVKLTSSGIYGYVFNDLNGNKSMDPGEAGISGVRIEVWKNEGGWLEVANSITDERGYYEFDLPPGNYVLVEDYGNAYDSSDQGADPDGYISTSPNSVSVNLLSSKKSVNFGDFSGFKIEGYVFDDSGNKSENSTAANNALKDPEESGIPDALVKLKNGTEIYFRNTDSSGKYVFLIQGNPVFPITITEEDKAGFSSTGDHDSDGADPLVERNRIIIDGISDSSYDFADVEKMVLKGYNGIRALPGSIAVLYHTVEIKTPGSISVEVNSNSGFEYVVYETDFEGNVLEVWDQSKSRAAGIYPFAIFITIPSSVHEGLIENISVSAIESWINSEGEDSASVTDLIYISRANMALKKSVRNITSSTSWAVSVEARPEDILEYKVAFSNNGVENIKDVVIIDPIDNHLDFLKGVYSGYDVLLQIGSESYLLVAETGGDLNLDGTYMSNGKLVVNIGYIKNYIIPGEYGALYYKTRVSK